MPIKFRCEHCQQLLGISRSRAAAQVDCPQCGRTLKVPGAPPDEIASKQNLRDDLPEDENLMSALSQLTMLAEEVESAQSENQTSEDRPFEDSATVIQGKDAPEEHRRHALRSGQSPPQSETNGQSFSAETTDALEDLATWQEPASTASSAQISTDLLSEMQRVSTASSCLGTMVMSLLLMVVSCAGGWWLAKSGTVDEWWGNSVETPQTKSEPEEAKPNAARENVPVKAAVPAGSVITLSGQVLYVDEAGQTIPDDGAAVYLLPQSREGNLKVHARSFQREPSNADRRFSEAALSALGGVRVEADSDGRFAAASSREADEYQLVVVSRHKERPAQTQPDSAITNVLMPWFDSTIHIIGQRETVMRSYEESDDEVVIVVGE